MGDLVDNKKYINELLVNTLFELTQEGNSVLDPMTKQKVVDTLVATELITEEDADSLYETYADNALAQVNVSMMLHQSFIEIEGVMQKLTDMESKITSGQYCKEENIADQLNKNYKLRLDVQKSKIDSVYKHLKQKTEDEKLNIARRRLDMDNTSSMLHVAMQIDGSFEEKTNRLQKMLSRHADILIEQGEQDGSGSSEKTT